MVGQFSWPNVDITLGARCFSVGPTVVLTLGQRWANLLPTSLANHFKHSIKPTFCQRIPTLGQRWANELCCLGRPLPAHPATYAGLTFGILRGFDLILTWWEAISPLSDYFGFQIRFLKLAAQRLLGPALTRDIAPRPPPCTPCDPRRLDPRDFEGV